MPTLSRKHGPRARSIHWIALALAVSSNLACAKSSPNLGALLRPQAEALDGLKLDTTMKAHIRVPNQSWAEAFTLYNFSKIPITDRSYEIRCMVTPPEGAKLPRRIELYLVAYTFTGPDTYIYTTDVRVKRKSGKCAVKRGTLDDGTLLPNHLIELLIRPRGAAIPLGTEFQVEFELT